MPSDVAGTIAARASRTGWIDGVAGADGQLPVAVVAAQAGRGVDPQEAAANERDAVAQAIGFIEVVGREDDRPPGAPELFDRLADDERRLRVERGGRFVEEDDRRVVEQRPGDGELLLHALAERAGHVVAPIPQREQAQVALDPLGSRRRIQPVQPAEELEVGGRAQLVVQARPPASGGASTRTSSRCSGRGGASTRPRRTTSASTTCRA